MSNKEIPNNNEGGDAGPSVWETTDFPEFSLDKGAEKDAVNIDKLAQELIAARKDAKEGATWDKEQRTYVGEDGLPRDWAHLVGYLKNNPDAVKTATEALDSLRGAEESDEGSIEDVDAEDTKEGAKEDAEVGEEIKEAVDATDDRPDTPKSRVEKLGHMEWWKQFSKTGTGSPDLVMDHFRRSEKEMVEAAGPKVKDAFDMHKAEEQIESIMDEVNDISAKLENMPIITLPWTKNGREKRELRRRAKIGEKRAEQLNSYVNAQREKLTETPLDKDEQETLEMIESAPKLILQGAEAQKKHIEGKLKELDEAEEQLKLPNDKRDMEKIDRVVTHAWMGDDHIREKIAKERDGWVDYLEHIEKYYGPLQNEKKDAA